MGTRVRGQGAPFASSFSLVSIAFPFKTSFPSLCDMRQGHLVLQPGMESRGPPPGDRVPTHVMGKAPMAQRRPGQW